MADDTPAGDGEKAKGKDAQKRPAEKRGYTILGAVGDKDASESDLDFRVIGEVEATTPSNAKAALLEQNPEFPRLDPIKDGEPDGPHQATDLQSLVRGERLWLHAESGFNPKPVLVEQPPPKFKGL